MLTSITYKAAACNLQLVSVLQAHVVVQAHWFSGFA